MIEKKETKPAHFEGVFPRMTTHFVVRYYQRILNETAPKNITGNIRILIKKDMKSRMRRCEITAMNLLYKTSEAFIPFDRFNKLVIRNSSLITIY